MSTPVRVRRSHCLLNWLLGIIAFILLVFLIHAITHNGNLGTQPPAWNTTHTFTGTGNSDTLSFTTYNHWRLRWKCHPSDTPFQFIANATNDSGQLDYITYSVCDENTPNGLADGHVDGTMTLEIQTQGPWTVDIEEWK